jgi:hypothetical protein
MPTEQELIDARRRAQATQIIDDTGFTTLYDMRRYAIEWCINAMQETANAEYWRERAEAAERLVGQLQPKLDLCPACGKTPVGLCSKFRNQRPHPRPPKART